MDIDKTLKQKSVAEADRIFDMISKERATTFIRGTEIMAVSRESLRCLVFNAMVDGAKIFSDELKRG